VAGDEHDWNGGLHLDHLLLKLKTHLSCAWSSCRRGAHTSPSPILRFWGSLSPIDVKVYEVDAPATQQEKVAALAKAEIDASHVTFVAVDFQETFWFDALTENGFDKSAPPQQSANSSRQTSTARTQPFSCTSAVGTLAGQGTTSDGPVTG